MDSSQIALSQNTNAGATYRLPQYSTWKGKASQSFADALAPS